MSDLVGEILQSRKDSQAATVGEKAHSGREKGFWSWDNEHLADFDDFFQPILNKPIETLIEEYKDSHPETYIMNLMGGVQLLRELKPSRGVAIRLSDTRTEDEMTDDINHNLYVIKGDILSKSLWRRIPAEQDFIFSMPQGALYSIPINENMYYFLINEIWKKLREGGTMFVQGPNFAVSWLEEWIPILNKNLGIDAKYAPSQSHNIDYVALSVVKSYDYPAHLPPLVK